MSVVLDASALLAFLHDEPGADRVAQALADGAAIGAVDLADVVSKLAEHGMTVGQIERALEQLGLDVQAFDAELAYLAGRLHADARGRGLSRAGSACLALGLRDRRTVLTADRAWADRADVEGVRVEAIR